MCGIVGYTGTRDAAPILVEALRKLEYRGYDSAGIATVYGSSICWKKDVGRLAEVEAKLGLSSLPGCTGIGHVRWATRGSVSQCNAHPQFDCNASIAVVHNGIIENAAEIKNLLRQRHVFLSDTDTEVISHLLEEHLNDGETPEQAISIVNAMLKGPYAYLAVSITYPELLMASASSVALAVARNVNGMYAGSDPISFGAEQNETVYLENGEIALIAPGNTVYYDSSGRKIEKMPSVLKGLDTFGSPVGGIHYMLKEILEQPLVIKNVANRDDGVFIETARQIQDARQVIFTACGTSRFASLLGRYLFSSVGKKFSDVILASEFGYFSDSMNKDTLVIGVSQSGETADILTGIRSARDAGASIISVLNRAGSSLARLSNAYIMLNCGEEIAVAATKSFTAEVVVFYLLSYAMAGKLEFIKERLLGLSTVMESLIHESIESAQKLAAELAHVSGCFVIGRGPNLHIATEAALKLKEIAYIHTEGMPAGELKHGTLALIDEGTPVLAVCPRDFTFADTIANAEEAQARGARIIGISDEDNDIFDTWMKIPKVDEVLYPLVSILPLQLLAYYSALERGHDPDRPRNLAKSVTVR
jgi:glucosamine--fructose-6-phosphate aminotransferase (isomerizing)